MYIIYNFERSFFFFLLFFIHEGTSRHPAVELQELLGRHVLIAQAIPGCGHFSFPSSLAGDLVTEYDTFALRLYLMRYFQSLVVQQSNHQVEIELALLCHLDDGANLRRHFNSDGKLEQT